MTKTDLIMEAKGVSELMEKLSETMTSARRLEAEARVNYERVKQGMDDVATAKIVEIANRPEISGAVDPRTGKANADWAKMLTQQALAADPEFMEIAEVVYKGRDNLYYAQSEAQDVADRIGTARTRAILLSSLLRYLAAVDEDI